ncbi:hypothetical protein CTAYLR_007164 [Chrysophaeum taylorii]|uniref:SnoaL-like domain-containing protein n=1 Tax=Chrysophaeum taylorii TaxID=2483200 RepID=A0AAD7UKL6_9STRA|nr:hypothetical protein CTAYLR_007164 [Chrysophaeum taylorii]
MRRALHTRRIVLPRHGEAVCALGTSEACIRAIAEYQPRRASLAFVVAACDAALRRVLESRELTASNIVGCVEPGAFAPPSEALVASVDCGDGVEPFTFDSQQGALPDMGRARLADALEPDRAPHFIIFAGRHHDDLLRSFARRVDGLFPRGSCAGVLVRGNDARPGRLVHARRRVPGGNRRAGRLRVHAADGAAVGVALLPKHEAIDHGDLADAANLVASLLFGGRARRLWAAGDGVLGTEDQRVLATMMRFYQAFDDRDLATMAKLWTSDDPPTILPSVAHPGRGMVQGRDNVLRAWRAFLSHTHDFDDHDYSLGLDVQHVRLHVSKTLAYATCLQSIHADGAVQTTNVFLKHKQADDWRIAHHHASLNFEDDDDLLDESNDIKIVGAEYL